MGGSKQPNTYRRGLCPAVGIATLVAIVAAGCAAAQDSKTIVLPTVDISEKVDPDFAYAEKARTSAKTADLGPLGKVAIKDTPRSVTVVTQDVLVNQQVTSVNRALGFLPSVEIRDQQGFDISRPQSRGFQSSIAENTRMDGLNVIGTTAIPVEALQRIDVLNGPAGALFGPETPAGVFNYVLKRPTETPLFRYIESFSSHGVFTEAIDAGGMTGPDNRIGYRVNLLHGQGEEYVDNSYLNRTLGSVALDYHFDNQTVLETNYIHYATDETGLPGAIVYFGPNGTNTLLPNGLDPTRQGLGQPGAGVNLRSDTTLAKFKHDFNADWHLEIGALYENAIRNLYGITNTLTDNFGDAGVTKNFNAVPRFTIASNSAYLNGHFLFLGTKNDLTIGTNGFMQGMYNYRNSIAQNLGTTNIYNPTIFPSPGAVPATGGLYYSGYQRNQSLITGDTMHFNDKVAVQGVLSTSFLHTQSFDTLDTTTSSNTANFALSPTASLILTPTSKLTGYFTFASSIEPGDTAPAGTANANAILAPYQDKLYEVGAKYAFTETLLVTLAGFRMTRPYAFTSATTNLFQVGGQQRNYGVELFGQGAVSPELSVLGGATWIDARLQNSGVATTEDKLIVGVPHWKSDVLLDYHPVAFHGGALTLGTHYEDARAAVNTNTTYASSFFTLDVGARYSTAIETHHATFRFQVINVNDARYYVSVADGNIVGSAGANTAYVGTPRTYQASLELDF